MYNFNFIMSNLKNHEKKHWINKIQKLCQIKHISTGNKLYTHTQKPVFIKHQKLIDIRLLIL